MRRILIVKLGGLSEYLGATPAIRALHRAPDTGELYLVCSRKSEEAARRSGFFSRIIAIDERRLAGRGLFLNLPRLLAIALQIRRLRAEIAISFERFRHFNLLLLLGGIRRRIGFHPGGGRFLTERVAVSELRHRIFLNCALLSPLKLSCIDARMHFPLSLQEQEAAEYKFGKLISGKGAVLVALGGEANPQGMESRSSWPDDSYLELIRMLLAAKYDVLMVGNPDLRSRAMKIASRVPEAANLVGELSLAETGWLMQGSRLFIGQDSDLLQLACAMGTKVIGLFGPTNPASCRPLKAGSSYLWKKDSCDRIPCCQEGVALDCRRWICLEQISPLEVLREAERTIGNGR